MKITSILCSNFKLLLCCCWCQNFDFFVGLKLVEIALQIRFNSMVAVFRLVKADDLGGVFDDGGVGH